MARVLIKITQRAHRQKWEKKSEGEDRDWNEVTTSQSMRRVAGSSLKLGGRHRADFPPELMPTC